MKVTFAHGLWSSTESSKAAWMRAQGWDVTTLDMRKYGWDQASQTRVVVEAIDELGPFDVLIGSSFGGLATANAAAQRPRPTCGWCCWHRPLATMNWLPQPRPRGHDRLENTGEHTFHPPGWDEPVVLPWSFVEVARTHAWPALHHPTAILHGNEDDVVPLANSERAKGALSHVSFAGERRSSSPREFGRTHRAHSPRERGVNVKRFLHETPTDGRSMSEPMDYASAGVDIDLEGSAVASLIGALSSSVRQPGTPGHRSIYPVALAASSSSATTCSPWRPTV